VFKEGMFFGSNLTGVKVKVDKVRLTEVMRSKEVG